MGGQNCGSVAGNSFFSSGLRPFCALSLLALFPTSHHHLFGHDRETPEDSSIGRDDATLQKMDRPVRRYLETLAQVCEHAPDRVLLSHGSVAEQCRLLREPLTAVQMLAYKQLQTILIEQVQELSIQMEIKAPTSPSLNQEGEDAEANKAADVDDKMTTPKFPASL